MEGDRIRRQPLQRTENEEEEEEEEQEDWEEYNPTHS